LQRASIRFCHLFLRSIDSFESEDVESIKVNQTLPGLSRTSACGTKRQSWALTPLDARFFE
jgi:hypothetical protein